MTQEETQTPRLKKITKKLIDKKVRETVFDSALAIVVLSFVFGFLGGIIALLVGPQYLEKILGESPLSPVVLEVRAPEANESVTDIYQAQTSAEEKIINIVKTLSPSVVSVVATTDLPIFEQYFGSPFGSDPFFDQFFPEFQIPQQSQNGTERREISSGTGFVVAPGFIVTNKHVVADRGADFTVVTSSGDTFEVEVLARDPTEDLAILKVEGLDLAPLALGDSDDLAIGQTVLAIGNALGELENSVSVGVVSGLSRTLTARGLGGSEILREVIQTDAAINPGNSGGPLINLSGEVIGINVARAVGVDNIGFSVPINRIKNSLEQIKKTGIVRYPFLGVRYLLITEELQEENGLSVDHGALIIRGDTLGQLAVVPGSAADIAGIVENDIILEVDGERVSLKTPLADVIARYNVGDLVTLKIFHKGEELTVEATLGERP